MSTLGSMLLSNRIALELTGMLEPDDFYRPAHREIYKSIRELVIASEPIDLITVKQHLSDSDKLADVGGVEYLIQLAEYVPSALNGEYYARIVLDKATLRKLENAGREIISVVHTSDGQTSDEKLNKAESLIFEVGRTRLGGEFKHVKGLADEFFRDIDHIVETGEPMTGITSGFSQLNRTLNGFFKGDMVVIGARPSMGKTAFALDLALAAAKEKKGPVIIFSLEMTALQLMRRMVSMVAGVSSGVLSSPEIGVSTYQKLADACELLSELDIFIDDASDISPLEMMGKCRRIADQSPLAMVVVDYLQLMRGSRRTDNRTQEISEIARGLKGMAKELLVPVLALSQLNRGVEQRDDKRPVLSDIRESGSIEAEADVVMLLYRDAYYKAKEEKRDVYSDVNDIEQAEIIVAKHRNGPTGKVILGFQPAFARYRDVDWSIPE